MKLHGYYRTIAFDETSSYLSAPNFSAFHWSPHGCLITTGQHIVTARVVHLPKRTETSLIIESDKSRANHQLLQLCMVCTAWSDSDQAVHSCKCWFTQQFSFSSITDSQHRKSIARHCVKIASPGLHERVNLFKTKASEQGLKHTRDQCLTFLIITSNESKPSSNCISVKLYSH